MTKEQINIRIEPELIKRLDEIAKDQSKKLNFKVTKSAIVNKALKEFCDNYPKK